MPSPSFSTPRSVKPSITKKHFTVAEANKTLPLVKRIASDLVRTHERALILQAELELLDDQKLATGMQDELRGLANRLHSFVAELNEIGCDVKDFKTGLIDFLGQHEGRDVSLCWRLGEEKINFWHELSAGFAGRKPIHTLAE
jgi:hypothetical protein